MATSEEVTAISQLPLELQCQVIENITTPLHIVTLLKVAPDLIRSCIVEFGYQHPNDSQVEFVTMAILRELGGDRPESLRLRHILPYIHYVDIRSLSYISRLGHVTTYRLSFEQYDCFRYVVVFLSAYMATGKSTDDLNLWVRTSSLGVIMKFTNGSLWISSSAVRHDEDWSFNGTILATLAPYELMISGGLGYNGLPYVPERYSIVRQRDMGLYKLDDIIEDFTREQPSEVVWVMPGPLNPEVANKEDLAMADAIHNLWEVYNAAGIMLPYDQITSLVVPIHWVDVPNVVELFPSIVKIGLLPPNEEEDVEVIMMDLITDYPELEFHIFVHTDQVETRLRRDFPLILTHGRIFIVRDGTYPNDVFPTSPKLEGRYRTSAEL